MGNGPMEEGLRDYGVGSRAVTNLDGTPNKPARLERHQTLTEYRRKVAVSAVAPRSVNKSFGGSLPLHNLASPSSIGPFPIP
ncbi:hypothetical protein EVAR_93852_1 [Eumeta japonica]|uniref:Uncharacterized protein n=1 Tax=Eumeta variegata TaxID=151549 RepID=A0A4C1TWP1_EUMVA|nr:hypothetical protein EVAR_93852_1 [Eumeta japonica]